VNLRLKFEDIRDRWDSGWRSPSSFSTLLPSAISDPQQLDHLLATREAAILTALAGIDDLHALRIVVVPPEPGHGPRLLLNSVADSTPRQQQRRLAAVLARHLHDIVGSEALEPAAFAALLGRHRIREATLFHASPGLSLRQIREDARLRHVLREWIRDLRAAGTLDRMSLDEARLHARLHVQSLNDPTCASGTAPPVKGRWRRCLDLIGTFLFFPLLGVLGKDIQLAVCALQPGVNRVAGALLVALWWLYAAPFTALAFIGVRTMEILEPDFEPPPAPEKKLHRLEAVEDARTKNELTIWFPVKPTVWGRLLMRLTLFGSERGTRHLWTRGTLAGAQNIHFARLLLADGGRRMVFMSDYSGSFDAYIDHFIGVGGNTRAVVPISSRVFGCPQTRWLYFPKDTASFRTRWRAMVRSYQLQAGVRYVAYPDLSANDILSHQRMRAGLFAENLSAEALEDWVRRI